MIEKSIDGWFQYDNVSDLADGTEKQYTIIGWERSIWADLVWFFWKSWRLIESFDVGDARFISVYSDCGGFSQSGKAEWRSFHRHVLRRANQLHLLVDGTLV